VLASACGGATDNFLLGGVCSAVICPSNESCAWDNNIEPWVNTRVHASQYSPGDFYVEAADDFIMKGDAASTNGCEIDTIRWRSFHFNHQNDGMPPSCNIGGGGTSGCEDNPNDYDAIRVTIYNDSGLPGHAGKGPTGNPTYDGEDPPADPLHSGVMAHEVTVPGPASDSCAPGLGMNCYSFETAAGGQEHVITMHFDPPLLVEKNKKYWLAVAPEVDFLTYYQTAAMRSNSYNGNVLQQYFPLDLGLSFREFHPDDPLDPTDLSFDISGIKEIPFCAHSTCQRYGDIFPDSNGGAAGGEVGNCIVDVDDISCVLDGFAGFNAQGCVANGNIAFCPNIGALDVDDISAVLDSFAGIIPAACTTPCGGACCTGGGNCVVASGDPASANTCGGEIAGTYAGDGTVCTDIPDPCP
jgi:hypothetical protein